MVTVAEIAKEAFDGVAVSIEGVVKAATMEYDTQGAYNAATGTYALTPTSGGAGRAIVGTAKAVKSSFPAYVAGPNDILLYLEGFTSSPSINWRVSIDGVVRVIKHIGDVVGAGGFFEVVAA